MYENHKTTERLHIIGFQVVFSYIEELLVKETSGINFYALSLQNLSLSPSLLRYNINPGIYIMPLCDKKKYDATFSHFSRKRSLLIYVMFNF